MNKILSTILVLTLFAVVEQPLHFKSKLDHRANLPTTSWSH